MRYLVTVTLMASLLIPGCFGVQDAGEVLSVEESVPLIPREVLFGNPDRTLTRISPDGEYISFLAPVDGVLNVWVGPVRDLDEARPVTNETYRSIRSYGWSYTNRHIFYLQDKDGDENWRVYSVTLGGGEVKDLTPFEGVQARTQTKSVKYPEEITVGLNNRDPTYHDLYRVNLVTGNLTLMEENDEFSRFNIDNDFNVRLANKMTPVGGIEISRRTDDGWVPFIEVGMEDVMGTGVVGFNKAGDVAYFSDSRNRDTAALYTLNLSTGEEALVAEDPRADFCSYLIHPTEKHIQAVAFDYDRRNWTIIDPAIEGDMEYLVTVADGELELVDRTLDDRIWIVVYLRDDGPASYYYYNRDDKTARFLFSDRKVLEDQPLAEMYPLIVKSRDGLDLVCYYTLPLDSDKDGDGRPNSAIPTVLLVHGGPWGRDVWGYSPLHQWLSNRGYAVLSVNFRGSTGFGKNFTNAGNLEWGRKMHEDLLDAVYWAVDEGIADPEKVAIMGASYGGYATLTGMTSTPEVFACGVDIVGPSNLITLLESVPSYWEPQMKVWTTRVGDFRTEEGRELLKERSPLNYVDKIKKPLLIGQGANDPRVSQNESDQIVDAMTAKNLSVAYVLYSDEGHGFARPENRLSFYAVAEAFLARHLGGRYEPVGDDFQGSTISVPVGAKEVPGLEDALPS